VPGIDDTRWATTAEVCEAGGISGPTAFRWAQKGVLPAPQKVHGGQRGLSSRWPLHAPAQAAWVKAKLDRGFTFEEIAGALAAGEYKAASASKGT
jgi:DNA-binding transcriptional MerR regulator